MIKKLCVLLFVSQISFAACPDQTGAYVYSFLNMPISQLGVEQKGCETWIGHYKMRNGMKMDRTLELDGKKRVSVDDPENKKLGYEWAVMTSEGPTVYGETFVDGKLDSTSIQTFRINEKGALVDRSEEFDKNGKSQGPITMVYAKY